MSVETARLVVYAGAAVAAVAWLLGWLKARAMAANTELRDVELKRDVVEGAPESVARELARTVSGQAGAMLSAFSIEDASRDTVRLRGQSIVPFLRHVHATFSLSAREPQKTTVIVHHDRGAVRRAAAVSRALSVYLGLPVVVILTAVLLRFVVHAEQPAVRAQAFQIMQAVHVLWPPFLVQYLGKRNQRLADEALLRILAALRFC